MRAAFRLRLRLILGCIVLAGLLILTRLYFVQIVDGDNYALKADHQYTAAAGGLFDRGTIYFTRKDGTLISAATLETGFLVAVNPQTLVNANAVYAAIEAVASTTVVSRATFAAETTGNPSVYVEVAHHLPEAAGEALAAENVPGVEVLRERWPYYPGGELAAQSIGIVAESADDSNLSGRTGLEAYYDGTLVRDGDLYNNFFAELFSNIGDILVNAQQAKEGNVVTTIEPEVETRLADDLAKVNAEYSSKESGGIIMDPKTGAIVALATYPTFDLNDFQEVDPTLLGNPLVEHVYEFGSIMKSLTMASGLNAGVITPDTTYDDTGCITVSGATICNYDLVARGVIPMQQILSQSLNVGASWIATQLGQDQFRTYFTKLFGQKTGIDLPSETGALISNLSTTEQVNYDTAAFGQGIAVTPVAMIRALGTLANNGAMVEPHLVSSIQLDNGIDRPLDWSGQVQVFTPQTVQEVTTMLTYVADVNLGNGVDKIPTTSVAAKTGTAQLEKPGGGYYQSRYFHSFFGYFPSYNPRFIILLYTNDPQGVEYASETLTATFEDLVHFLIDYYNIPPDRGVATTTPAS